MGRPKNLANTAAAPKKKGPKSLFTEEQLDFLMAWIPVFQAAQKSKRTLPFWANVYQEYTQRFPVSIEDVNEESDSLKQDNSGDDTENGISGTGQETENEETEKIDGDGTGKTKANKSPNTPLMTRIRNWFNNHSQIAVKKDGSLPFTNFVADCLVQLGPSPRRVPNFQFYMRHPDYQAKVQAAFDAEWPVKKAKEGLDDKDSLAFRNNIASRLFDKEDPDVQARVKQEAEDEYQELLGRYNAAKVVPDPDTEGHGFERQLLARDRLATIFKPLLLRARRETGLHFVLLAGAPPEPWNSAELRNKHTLISICAGKTTDGLEFSQFKPQAFEDDVMGHFMSFLTHTVKRNSSTSKSEDSAEGSKVGDTAKTDDVEDINVELSDTSTSRASSPPVTSKVAPTLPATADKHETKAKSKSNTKVPPVPTDEQQTKAKKSKSSTKNPVKNQSPVEEEEETEPKPKAKKSSKKQTDEEEETEPKTQPKPKAKKSSKKQTDKEEETEPKTRPKPKAKKSSKETEDGGSRGAKEKSSGGRNNEGGVRAGQRSEGSGIGQQGPTSTASATSPTNPATPATPASLKPATPKPASPVATVGPQGSGGLDPATPEPATPAAAIGPQSPAGLDPATTAVDGDPEWFKVALMQLSENDFGKGWDSVVSAWAAAERAANFNEGKGLGTANRPMPVTTWLRNGRGRGKKNGPPTKIPPPINNVRQYRESWLKWWNSVSAENPGLTTEVCRGRNGVFLVLLGLRWWRDSAGGNVDGWDEAVNGIRKVFAGTPPPTRKRKSEVSAVEDQAGSNSSSKKRRRGL